VIPGFPNGRPCTKCLIGWAGIGLLILFVVLCFKEGHI
jgi:hypothetical protein